MCVTCGCSDDAEAKITNLETGEVEHNHHTHTLADGTVITHSHQLTASQIHAKIHNTTISLEQIS